MDRFDLPFFEGQWLRRDEFHRLYKMTPDHFRAELIGGVVYFKGRVGFRHASYNATITGLLGVYESRTPGIKGGLHASTALDFLSEVHPDVLLRVKPERGGQSYDIDDIIGGAPEFVAEVADESRVIDLGPKLGDYERAGTLEYLVFALDPDEVFWHVRHERKLVRIPPDDDGLYRSRAFPGLWLDPDALIADDGLALIATLERGMATPEHAAFVARLADIRT
jgi:Uma2 family endonuclease